MVGRRSGYPLSGEATRQPPALGNGVRHAPPSCPGGDGESKSSQSTSAALVRPARPGAASRRTRGVPLSWKAAGCVTRTPTWHLASAEIQSQFTWGTRLLVCQANLDPVAERQDKIHKATCFEASRFHRRPFHFAARKGCVKWSRDCPRPCQPPSETDPRTTAHQQTSPRQTGTA